MKLPHLILDLLYPPKCVLCQRLLSKQETDLCTDCRKDTDSYISGKERISFIASSTVLWYYEGKIRESLLRYKFSGRRNYANVYARLLAVKLLEQRDTIDLITWVPISKARLRRRGYDQCMLLANALSRELDIPAVCTLQKIRNNRIQSRLGDISQRKANVLGVYRSINRDSFFGKRILLLDDIITTGATMGECARVLTTDGAVTVHGAAVAAASHTPHSTSR